MRVGVVIALAMAVAALLAPGYGAAGATTRSRGGIPVADLQVAVWGPPLLAVGDHPVEFWLLVDNAGPRAARAVRVHVTLPQGLELVRSAKGRCAAATDSQIVCKARKLAVCPYAYARTLSGPPAPSPTCPQFDRLLLRATEPGVGAIDATAKALLNLDYGPGPNESTVPVSMQRPPLSADVAVSAASVPSRLELGQHLPYDVTLTNNGPGDATRVVVNLSGAIPSFSQSDPCIESWGCVPLLPAGATRVVRVMTDLPPPDALGQTIVDVATARSDTPDPNPWNNSASAETKIVPPSATADLGVSMTAAPDAISEGGTATFTTTVVNHGPDAATGVVLQGSTGPYGQITSASGPAGDCEVTYQAQTKEIISRCDLGTIAPGASAQATATVTLAPSALIANLGFVAYATTTAYDPTVFATPGAARNDAEASVTVSG